jgi:transposase-like protein
MAAGRRPRHEWERLVREQERSGLSVRKFAATHGVNRQTLAWWRWRIRSDGQAETPCEPTRFVPVVLERPFETEPESVVEGQVEAALPNGVTLRFEHRLDVHGLRELAAAFGGA